MSLLAHLLTPRLRFAARRLSLCCLVLAAAITGAAAAAPAAIADSPVANFGFTPPAPLTAEDVDFDGAASQDPDGTVDAWSWDFGDGQTDTTSGAAVSHQFAVSGTYQVSLVVTDNDGNSSDPATKQVTVTDRPPVADFGFTPPAPLTAEDVDFDGAASQDPDGTVDAWSWDFGDGQTDTTSGAAVSHQFAVSGTYQVSLVVTDNDGNSSDPATKQVTVTDRPPVADFGFTPAFPLKGDTVTFDSSISEDPDGTIDNQSWDLDNDTHFDDGTGVTAQRSFADDGTYTVRLEVTDNNGNTDVVSKTVVVGNRPPMASFVFIPESPLTGDTVHFFSTSSDPDGPLASQTWDLDNDGEFDDASGPTAARSFATPVSYQVSLRVQDSDGAVVIDTQTVVVASPAAPTPPAQSTTSTAKAPGLLTPFPIVRIAGTMVGKGIRLRLFIVDAPANAKVKVRCRGRRCPFRKRTATAASLVRIRQLERRLLPRGMTIEVFITKPNTIGKYTRFKVRKGKPPARADRCIAPGTSQPVDCPTS